ncbi:MAG: preprotein translocase subunit YajC [Oscillospiraceae bacterium]|nr:preprotein translocase subunit YajC [Oscillospiraceae bacterium]
MDPSLLIFPVIIAVFYFLIIRPENKKKKKLGEMRNQLSNGDEITTIGGIVGKVVQVTNDYVTFETGEDRVRLQILKGAVSSVGGASAEQPK